MSSDSRGNRKVLVQPLELVKAEELCWAWDGVIPMGVVTLLGGRAGIGKSTILAWLTSKVTNGELEGNLHGIPSVVSFVAGEDDTARVLLPRLLAAGAKLSHVNSITLRHTEADGETWIDMPSIGSDLPELKETLIDAGTSLLIVDPLSATMDGDTNSEQVVRSQLGRLAGLAGDLNIAIVAVKHWHKGSGASIDRISGSHGFTDIGRSVLQLAPDEENDQLILTVDKSNYDQRKPSFAFQLQTVEIPTENESVNRVGKAKFLGETDLRVEDILAREATDNLSEVNKQILDYLDTRGESKPDQIASAISVPVGKVRTYLQRLYDAGRVERIGRGLYTPLKGVKSVKSVKSDYTLNTLNTPLTGVTT